VRTRRSAYAQKEKEGPRSSWRSVSAVDRNINGSNENRLTAGSGDRTVDEMAHAWINIVYMKDDDFKIEQDKRRATQTTAAAQQ
jgi:hypothetical protein